MRKYKLNKNKMQFIGNTSWMMVQQIYSMLISLVVGSLSARYLGPSNYGLINYGATIISFFYIISKLGLDSVIINEMVLKPDKQGAFLGSALAVRLMTSILSFGCIYGIVYILEPRNRILHVITLLQGIAIILQSYEVFVYWFQVKLQMKIVSIATMIALTVVAVWKITLLATDASVEWFALSNSINYFVSGSVVIVIFFKTSGIKLKYSGEDSKFLLSNSYHFIVSSLAVTLYCQIDKIMIGKISGEEMLGLYTAATTIAGLWEFVPTALINSARPLIIEARDKDYKKYIEKLQQLMLAITGLAIIVGVIMMLLGRFIIYGLYGKAYMSAYVSLVILIWSTGIAMIATARTIWFVAEGKSKYIKYFTIIGAVINMLLNALIIPFWGISGAAITTCVSQMIVCFIAPLLYKETRKFVEIYFNGYRLLSQFIKNLKSRI